MNTMHNLHVCHFLILDCLRLGGNDLDRTVTEEERRVRENGWPIDGLWTTAQGTFGYNTSQF